MSDDNGDEDETVGVIPSTNCDQVYALTTLYLIFIGEYSETSLKRPPKGPANSGRYREVVRIWSATLTYATSRSILSLIYCSFDFVI